MTSTKSLLSFGAAALAAAAFVSPISAQEEAPSINNGAVSFALGADVPTKYIFRGYELEEDGLIVQPYAEASFAIADGIDLYIGTWNSIHSDDDSALPIQGADGETTEIQENWFESDFYAGISLGMFDPISIDISYVHYLYPNGNFGDYKEIDVAVAYDDSELWGGDFTISPYALIAFEFDTDDSFGDDDNIYLELGGETGISLFESTDFPIDLTIPVTIGLSLDEFYVDEGGDNEFFGFVSVGANVGMPLDFIPSQFGTWSAGAGLTLFILNDNANLDDGDNEEFNIVGTVGIAMEY